MKSKYVFHETGEGFWFELIDPNGQRIVKSDMLKSFSDVTTKIILNTAWSQTNIIEKHSPKMKDASCLEYLIALLDKGEDFIILYNENHCIGVSDKGIFEKDSHTFKRDLIQGFVLGGSDRYLKLHEHYSLAQIKSSFNLNENQMRVLGSYYEKKLGCSIAQ